MFDLNNIIEFSHLYCVEICGFLVPTNVLASLQPIFFTVFHRPKKEINLMALVASFYALIINRYCTYCRQPQLQLPKT